MFLQFLIVPALKFVVLPALVTLFMNFPVSAEDPYIQAIHENGEVIACDTLDSYKKLTSGVEIGKLVDFCHPTLVTGELRSLGWTFFGASPDEVASGNFVPARKYEMSTDEGKNVVYFAWPYRIDPSDYAMFNNDLFAPTPEELAEFQNPGPDEDLPELAVTAVIAVQYL